MCTEEHDIDEQTGMCGPLCWQGYDKDPGGFKKLMWYGIMKEFNCKATSTLPKCGRAKETAFTHKQLGQKRQEVTSLLDHIVGPRRRDKDVYKCNDVRTWATWDHYPRYARIQEEEKSQSFPKEIGRECEIT